MAENHLIICPGFHDPGLTKSLLTDLSSYPALQSLSTQVADPPFPWGVLSGYQVRQLIVSALGVSPRDLSQAASKVNLLFLAFSAGCVGALAAARHWYALGGGVGAVFLVDGWGVALADPFPSYRLSHDRFTHDTSGLLGHSPISFYADPAVPHRDLWRSPRQAQGYQVLARGASSGEASDGPMPTTAADFICTHLEQALLR